MSRLSLYFLIAELIFSFRRFLRSEPAPELAQSMGVINQHIHSVVAELLQVIISRGESDLAGLQSIESALSSRLYLSIHRSELDLQNKLLHVLHSVIHAIAAIKRNEKVSVDLGKNELKARDLDNLAQPASITHDAMFVKIVADAVSKQQNSAVVHHWIDFLLMTIPQIRHTLVAIVLPLIDCLIGRLRTIVQELNVTYTFKKSGISSEATDAEFTVIMNALERLLLIAVAEARAVATDIEPRSPDQRMLNEIVATPTGGGGGLLGYMTGVLASAEIEPTEISEEEKVSCWDGEESFTDS